MASFLQVGQQIEIQSMPAEQSDQCELRLPVMPQAEDDRSSFRYKAVTVEEEEKGASVNTPRKRNAFSELMAPRTKQQKTEVSPRPSTSTSTSKPALSGLLAYITNPTSFPPGTIVRETGHSILIRDLYPKALVHLLLLPKNPAFYKLTPFEAFNPTTPKHTAFLTLMKSEAASAAKLAASELSRLVSPHSISCQARLEAMESLNPPTNLPVGRDFLPDIKIGIHAQPSMNTLHIHIISVDNYSACLKHKKHYNSFNTDFFVSLDDFPLMGEDNLMDRTEQESLLKGDMKCWRCKMNVGNKFRQLKGHLEEEYKEWRAV